MRLSANKSSKRWGEKAYIDESRVTGLLNAVVVLAIAVVAYTDWVVIANVSLGYLYVLPLSLSALINPLTFTVALAAICAILQDIFGPPVDTVALKCVHFVLSLAGFLIVSFLVTLVARQRDRLAREVRRQRDEYEHDLVLASHVQQQVLPQPLILPDIELAAMMRTARLLGGDYYDFFQVSDDVVDVIIADVSGKGVAASLLMPSLAVALRLRARELSGPAEILASLDKILREITNPATFVTIFYARFHRTARILRYASGGHNPPILMRADTDQMLMLKEAGPIVGILDNARYSDTAIRLDRGDILTLFTDGISEQENEKDIEFSVERLEALVRDHKMKCADAIARDVSEAVSIYAGKKEQMDDMSIVVMKIKE